MTHTRKGVFFAAWCLCGVSAAAITLVSVDEEIAIGKQAEQQVRQQMAVLRDATVASYVSDLGKRLVKSAPGPKYPYRLTVADYREINAFALPGGPVWMNRGVLHAAATESQVAGVLAHEVAHIAQRHAADQLTKSMMANWGLGLLGAVLGNSGGAGAAQAAAGLFTNGIFLKFSRDDEREADRIGLEIMTRAGWDGRGMVELLEILRREANRDPAAVELFLSTHPSPQERIARLQAEVARRPRGVRDTKAFRAIKARVMKMAPPKAMPTQR
jgi:beta-barrel assembly-enhancing protease